LVRLKGVLSACEAEFAALRQEAEAAEASSQAEVGVLTAARLRT